MFQSESSADKQYHAFAFRLDEIDFCPCVAFVMARNKEAKRLGLKDKGISAAGLASDCKHLKEIRRVTCQWTQESEADYRWDETCPKCGGAVVEEGRAMIPEGAGTDHVDDLKAMLSELRGTPAPGEVVAEVETAEVDAVIEAAEDAVSTADEEPPVNRQHGTIPTDPAEWIEDLIASRNGAIPTGDDWKSLRELWGPIYGKRNIDRAYKAAGTADAALARMVAAPAPTAEDEPDPKARLELIRAAIHAENISYGEIAELQGLVEHIDPSDAELLEWAGVSEEDYRAGLGGTAAPEEVIAELEDEYHGGPPELTVVQSGEEPEAEAERIHPSIPASVPTPPATARLILDGEGIDIVVTRSAGADGAVLVMISTAFEPDASDGGPGLRVLLNDEPIFAGKDYEPSDDDERDHAETLPGEPGYDTSYGDKIDQADTEATGPEAAAQRLAARIK